MLFDLLRLLPLKPTAACDPLACFSWFESYLLTTRSFHTTPTLKAKPRKKITTNPFNFRSEQLQQPKSMDKVKLDIEMDQHRLPETRWPYKAARTKSAPPKFGPHAKAYVALGRAAGAQPPRSTRATRMRQDAVERTSRAALDAKLREESRLQLKETKAHRHQRAVSLTTKHNDMTLEIANARSVKTKAQQDREFALEQAFELELAGIQQRVENRTLLMEHGKDTFAVDQELVPGMMMAATGFAGVVDSDSDFSSPY
jgi:hypothetical protein